MPNRMAQLNRPGMNIVTEHIVTIIIIMPVEKAGAASCARSSAARC